MPEHASNIEELLGYDTVQGIPEPESEAADTSETDPDPETEEEYDDAENEDGEGEQEDDSLEDESEDEVEEDDEPVGDEEEAEGDQATEDEGEEVTEETPDLHAVKVDGKEREVTLEELKKSYELASAGHQRMQEANRRYKAAEMALKRVVDDPIGSAMQLMLNSGKTPAEVEEAAYQYAEKWILPRIEERQLPEQQQKIAARAREVDLREAQLKAREEETQAASQEDLNAQTAERVMSETKAALQKYGLPEEPEVVRRTSEILLEDLQQGGEMTPEDAVRIVRDERQKLIDSYTASITADELIAKNPELAQSIKSTRIKKAKARRKPRTTPSKASEERARRAQQSRKPQSLSEFVASVEQENM